jgi:hypothetical protein
MNSDEQFKKKISKSIVIEALKKNVNQALINLIKRVPTNLKIIK